MSTLNILRGCATIQLTKGQNTLVDERDWAELSKRKWCVSECSPGVFYAVRHIHHGRKVRPRQTRIYMHRDVLKIANGGLPPESNGDHKSRDTLDNCQDNVRVATIGQNRSNSRKKLWRGGKSSEYKGVSWYGRYGKWRAVIVKDKKQRELGMFSSETEAALAYNRAALEMHGEFARINEGI